MPLYDYKCRACSAVTEVRHDFRVPYEGTCPACGGALARVFNPAGILFKGPGFYLTDSRKQASDASSKASDSSKPSDSASKASETASKGADGGSKSDTPAPAAPASPAGDSGSKKSDASAA